VASNGGVADASFDNCSLRAAQADLRFRLSASVVAMGSDPGVEAPV
jgi:hypothetical protein